MDKAVQGRATQICPTAPHCLIICMKPALCHYPLCLVCSGPFNLCLSRTLPLCPTSNPYSHFIPLTPHSFHSLHSPQSEPTLWQDCHLWSRHNFLVAIVFPCVRRRSPLYPPGVSSTTANQQCNESRLPSTACWDCTSFSL